MNPLIITGMHRSGTSMITRILNICGLYIGPENKLMPPGGDNPKGFWESAEIMNINGRIMSTYFGDWENPPKLPYLFWHDKKMDDIHRIIKNFVTTYTQHAKWWGMKDPRFCLTLPIWHYWIKDPKILVCLRDPLSVADSLMRRDQKLTLDKCILLWSQYMRSLLDYTSRENRIVVSYDSFFKDPLERVCYLLNKLGGFNDYAVDYDKIEEACSTVTPELRHQNRKLKNHVGTTNISKKQFRRILDLQEKFEKDEIFNTKKD